MLSRRSVLAGVAAVAGTRVANAVAPRATMQESRTIFVEGLNWIDRGGDAAAIALCDRVKSAGFNVILAYIWHGYGKTWPSEVVSFWDSRMRPVAGEDPLAILLEVAHARGLEVHVTFTVSLRRTTQYPQFWTDNGTEYF